MRGAAEARPSSLVPDLQFAPMGTVERRARTPAKAERERALEVQLGPLGGFEVRPTRVFVWGGSERAGRERILSLGAAPRNLVADEQGRELRAGALRVRSNGNPVLTVALAGVYAARRLRSSRSAT